MEPCFTDIMQSLLNNFRHILLRKFFFSYTQKFYEKSLFLRRPLSAAIANSQRQKLKQNSKENSDMLKLGHDVDQALNLAKKAIGVQQQEKIVPRGPSRGRSRISDRRRPSKSTTQSRTLSEPKKVQMHDFSQKKNIRIYQDLMQQYQQIKSTSVGSSFGGQGQFAQAKKAEFAAKKNFITKLKQKCQTQRRQQRTDKVVTECYGIFQVFKQIKKIIDDQDLMRSFEQISRLPQVKSKQELIQLFKAFRVFQWIESEIWNFNSDSINDLIDLKEIFQQNLTRSGIGQSINKLQSFNSEKELLGRLKEACTKSEVRDTVQEYKMLDKVKIDTHLARLMIANHQMVDSIQGLKAMYTLLASKARKILTIAREN